MELKNLLWQKLIFVCWSLLVQMRLLRKLTLASVKFCSTTLYFQVEKLMEAMLESL